MRSIAKVLAVVFALVALTAEATHIRYMTTHAVQYNPTSGGNGRNFRFTIETAWRRSFGWSQTPNPGVVVNSGARFFPDSTSSTSFAMMLNVSTINLAQDWFTATSVIEFAYSTPGSKTVYWQLCCRISTLVNSRDGWGRSQAVVSVVTGESARSMRTTAVPIVTLFLGQRALFRIGVITFQNELTRYRLATPFEAAGTNPYTPVNGLIVSPEGLVDWTPSTPGLHTTQVVIEGHRGAISGNSTIESTVSVDFIINVVDNASRRCKRFCSNLGFPCATDGQCTSCIENGVISPRTPHCDFNFAPSFISVRSAVGDGSQMVEQNFNTGEVTVTAVYNALFRLEVIANDTDEEDFVSISSTVVPDGATVTASSNSNPTSYLITWRPEINQLGNIICFTASDSLLNSNSGQLCVRINVVSGDLTAEGECLRRAVAGEQCNITITNPTGPSHSVIIEGPGGVATAVVLPIPGQSGQYRAFYNFPGSPASSITRAGFYVITVSDTNPGIDPNVRPPSVVSNLRVVNARTDPYNHQIDNANGAGLSGGVSGENGLFVIQSRDRFGNDVTEPNQDRWFVQTVFNGVTQTNQATQLPEPQLFQANYSVPSSSNDAVFILRILFQNASLANPIVVYNGTANIFANVFSINLPGTVTLTVGKPFFISWNVEQLADPTRTTKVFSVTFLGNVVFVTNYNNGTYSISGVASTLAETYPSGLIIRSSGLSGGQRVVIVILSPDVPVGSQSELVGAESISASEVSTLSVILRDQYGNHVRRGTDTVNYVYLTEQIRNDAVPSGTTSPLASNAPFQSSSGFYLFDVETPYAGLFRLTLTLNGVSEHIDESPYTIVIRPGPLSPDRSEIVVPRAVVGELIEATVIAKDANDNERAGEVSDTFRAEFYRETPSGGLIYNYISSFTRDGVSGQYGVAFNSSVKGEHILDVEYVRDGEFTAFGDVIVRVRAGPIVPPNSRVSGSGVAEEVVSGSTASVLVQARDRFLNVVDNNDLHASEFPFFVIRVRPSKDRPIYYAVTHYCPPSALFCSRETPVQSNYAKNSFTGLQAGEEEGESFVTEELVLLPEGFFRAQYRAPELTTGDNDFFIDIFLCDPRSISSGDTASTMITKPTTTLIKTVSSKVVTQAGARFASALNDPWLYVVIGVSCGAIAIAAALYSGWRLTRYRTKYRVEKRRADDLDRRMSALGQESDIIPGGGTIDEAGMSLNPMLRKKSDQLDIPQPPQELEMVEAPQDVNMQPRRAPIRQEFKPVKPGAQPLA
jgi:hypothetical protein